MKNKKTLKSNREWKKILTQEQFNVLRKKATEAPGTNEHLFTKNQGKYYCVACNNLLFDSIDKFESGTGWPSFTKPAKDTSVEYKIDKGLFTKRTEVLCYRCEGHLGHVFDDGPKPTGKRYCMNGVALKFTEDKTKKIKTEKASFAAGCFWGIEENFRKLKGVVLTKVGYAGGNTKNPTYNEVSSGTTKHAETVEIQFNPKVISYDKLLEIFWKIHNPTTPNKQGFDIGSQYRSIIFYQNQNQKKLAQQSLKKQENKLKKKIVTEIIPIKEFYIAEEYHQKYLIKKNKKSCSGGCKI